MHDFILAKEIVGELLRIGKEKNLKKISEVVLKIGSIALSHDGLPEHLEEVGIENLEFGIKELSKNTILEGVEIKIERVVDNSWSIENIKGE